MGGTEGFAIPAGGTAGLPGVAGAAGPGREAAGGVALVSCVVSFFGVTPGALMRTVSRFTIGVTAGFGGSVMRTVSFFGVEELGVGVSSAIKM